MTPHVTNRRLMIIQRPVALLLQIISPLDASVGKRLTLARDRARRGGGTSRCAEDRTAQTSDGKSCRQPSSRHIRGIKTASQ